MTGRRFSGSGAVAIAAGAGAAAIFAGGGYLLIEASTPLAVVAAALVAAAAAAAGVLVGCPADGLAAALRAVGPAFAAQPPAEEIIEPLVRAARLARRQGLLSLDDTASRNADPFLSEALGMAADGVGAEVMRQVLEGRHRALRRRDEAPASVFDLAAASAQRGSAIAAVLAAMAGLRLAGAVSPQAALPALAALASGFAAAALLRPIAARIRQRADRAATARELIIDGSLAIRDGLTPRGLEQALRGRAGLTPLEELVEAPRRAA